MQEKDKNTLPYQEINLTGFSIPYTKEDEKEAKKLMELCYLKAEVMLIKTRKKWKTRPASKIKNMMMTRGIESYLNIVMEQVRKKWGIDKRFIKLCESGVIDFYQV